MLRSITGIRNVGLFSNALETQERFYRNVWGLDLVSETPEATYFRGADADPYILSLHGSSRKGLHHVAFAVPTDDDVRTWAAHLESRSIALVAPPQPLDTPGGGFGLAFRDPEGRRIEISSSVARKADGWLGKACEPISICHVVLNTTDIDGTCAFYTGVLGLRISDWSEHQMVFLRCNPKHHVISFNAASHASVNHVAYLVSDVDHVMRGIATLRKHGIEPSWGPGRHGPGNNIFCYYTDPAGYVAEYTADVQQISDDAAHQPKVWPRVPEFMDRWGTAGPPSAAVRSAMAGEPDPGWG